MHNTTFTNIHSENIGLIFGKNMNSNGNKMLITDSSFIGFYLSIIILIIFFIRQYFKYLYNI